LIEFQNTIDKAFSHYSDSSQIPKFVISPRPTVNLCLSNFPQSNHAIQKSHAVEAQGYCLTRPPNSSICGHTKTPPNLIMFSDARTAYPEMIPLTPYAQPSQLNDAQAAQISADCHHDLQID
jgi:hypothetical protein